MAVRTRRTFFYAISMGGVSPVSVRVRPKWPLPTEPSSAPWKYSTISPLHHAERLKADEMERLAFIDGLRNFPIVVTSS